MEINNITIQILIIWLLSSASAWILHCATIFFAPVIGTAIIYIFSTIDNYYKGLK